MTLVLQVKIFAPRAVRAIKKHIFAFSPMYRRAYVCAGGGASQGPSARRTPLDAAESTFMLIHIPTTISYSK